MINNAPARVWLTAALLALGCARAQAESEAAAFQGVVEFEQTQLSFELAGRVDAVHVKEGDRIAAGAPIASLDDELTRRVLEARAADVQSARAEVERVKSGARREDVQAAAARVDAAKASEALLEKNLARERALLEKNVVAQASVDALESKLSQASAERRSLEQNLLALRRGARSVEVGVAEARALAVEAAADVDEARLERHRLTAPAGGEVLDLHVELGEVVAAGAPVATLADTARPYVEVFVPQGKLAGVVVGAKARVKVDAEAAPFEGKVEHVAQRTEFTPRFLFSERERPNLVVRVRIRIDDPARKLHAGVPAFVTIAGSKP